MMLMLGTMPIPSKYTVLHDRLEKETKNAVDMNERLNFFFFTLFFLSTESDFSPQSGSITFSPGETSGSVLVTLSQDTMCDDDEETFSLLLESSDPNVRLGPRSVAEVFITDDDGMLQRTSSFFSLTIMY